MAGADVTPITIAELLEALATAQVGPDGAKTVLELAAEVDRPASTIQRALRRLHDEGRLVTHRVQRVAISGAVQRVPAYTILPRRP
jgi:predicted transcriptional regulator